VRSYRTTVRGPGDRHIRHNLDAPNVAITAFRRRWFRQPLLWMGPLYILDRDTVCVVLGRGRYTVIVTA
jgi:hypothetical protein